MLYDLLKVCVSIFFNIMNKLMGGKLPPFGSAAVIVEQEERFLVVELPRGRIAFPGGFMNWHETPQQAAQREGKEETGLDLCIDELLNVYNGASTSWTHMSTISFVFIGHVVGGKLQKNIEGTPHWLTEAELRKRMGRGAQRILDEYLQRGKQESIVIANRKPSYTLS